jgi:hypothetical protein
MLSFPVGLAAIFFAYKASGEDVGRGERIIWLACSCGLLLSVCLILLVMLTAL